MKKTRGCLMVDTAGAALTDDDRRRLRHPLVGGVILFTRNFKDRAQLTALTEEIHALRTPPLLVAVDQEGGRVQRFAAGFTRLPPAADYGRRFDRARQDGLDLAAVGGFVMAAELKAAGVDLCFAPVADIAGEGEVIGDRAFHARPAAVAVLAGAFMSGMNAAGMAAVAKHFPGHGGVSGDSHSECPVDLRGYDEVAQNDLAPYRALIAAGLGGVMTAHVSFARIDEELPSYSRFWLRRVLRAELGFHGAVFSDDLVMAGAACGGAPGERVRRALKAGCDMVLACNDFAFVTAILDTVTAVPEVNPRLGALFGHAPAATVTTSRGRRTLAEAAAILDRALA